MSLKTAIFFLALLTLAHCQIREILDIIQRNTVGLPLIHKVQSWPFDPDEGKRRSRQYQELNGKYGEKAIERLGLGIDGRDQERLAQQRKRDEGHLNGLNDHLP